MTAPAFQSIGRDHGSHRSELAGADYGSDALATLGDREGRLLAGPPAGQRESLMAHERRLGALRLPMSQGSQATLLDLIAASGLAGRGGGEFPLATKLRAAVAAPGVPVVVINGSESEPASRKDQTLLELRTHLVLDGALLVAAAVGAPQIVVYLHASSVAAHTAVLAALSERQLPESIGVIVTTCDAGFVAGESSAVVSALSGGRAAPARRSLPAATSGIHGRPTVVSNVETLAHLALIARLGATWFRSVGSPRTPGSTLVTLAGGVSEPGLVVETVGPVDFAALLRDCGNLPGPPRAVLLGGYGGRWISGEAAWRTPVDRGVLRRAGVGLGCGLVAPLPASACGLEVTVRLLDYLADQSAGQCGSCLFGLPRLATQLRAVVDGVATRGDVRRIAEVAHSITGRGACAHPDGAVALLESALEVFRDDVRAHVRGRHCGGYASGWFPLPDDNHLTDLS
jgi:NADH:ubiquinone oxidoreductase subunit F (NADH-binding)